MLMLGQPPYRGSTMGITTPINLPPKPQPVFGNTPLESYLKQVESDLFALLNDDQQRLCQLLFEHVNTFDQLGQASPWDELAQRQRDNVQFVLLGSALLAYQHWARLSNVSDWNTLRDRVSTTRGDTLAKAEQVYQAALQLTVEAFNVLLDDDHLWRLLNTQSNRPELVLCYANKLLYDNDQIGPVLNAYQDLLDTMARSH